MKKVVAAVALAAMMLPLTATSASAAAQTNAGKKVECLFYTYIQQADPMDCLT